MLNLNFSVFGKNITEKGEGQKNLWNKINDHFWNTFLNSINHESLAKTHYLYQMILKGCNVHADDGRTKHLRTRSMRGRYEKPPQQQWTKNSVLFFTRGSFPATRFPTAHAICCDGVIGHGDGLRRHPISIPGAASDCWSRTFRDWTFGTRSR